MKKLLQFVHPALEKSNMNSRLLKAARKHSDIHINDLYQEYPHFLINVPREQHLIESHEIIIFQFPLYWYSAPSLLKEWQDVVLEYGWAYGKNASALVGKKLKLVITTGGSKQSYCKQGHNKHTIEEFLCPITQSFALCGMEIEKPFVIHDALHLAGDAMDTSIDHYINWLGEESL